MRLLKIGAALGWALLLVACGSQPAAPAPTQPAPTPRPAVEVPTLPAPAPATPQPTIEDGIANSVTPEGYQVLGDPDAPVTLTMYSDFL